MSGRWQIYTGGKSRVAGVTYMVQDHTKEIGPYSEDFEGLKEESHSIA